MACAVPGAAPGRGEAQEGFALLEVALPSRLDNPNRIEHRRNAVSSTSDRVVIGMDPHKRSATIEVMAGDEAVLYGGRFGTDRDGYREMVASEAVDGPGVGDRGL
jgi:hypothetical protein